MGLNEEVAAAAAGAQKQAAEGGEQTPVVAEADKTIITPGAEGEPKVEESAAAEPEKEAKITIGGKDFETKEEAWAYAESLQQKMETESLANDMYRQGLQDAALATKSKEEVTPEAEPEENFEEEFYADPQAYMKKMQEKSAADAQKLAQKMFEERDQAAEQKAKEEALWTEFYEGNQDLQGKDTLVKAVLNQNWAEYQNLTPKLAMAKLSTAVRAELRAYGLEAAPQADLDNPKGPVSTGGDPNVTTPKAPEKPLSFVAQVNNLQSKGINS